MGIGDWLGSAVGGALGLGGSLWSSSRNISSAREQMAFQERMYKTRHQMEVEDLKAAGLNPILSSFNGGAAPQGAQATVENPGESAIRGFSAAQQASIAKKQLALQEAEIESRIKLNSAQAARQLAESSDITARLESGLYGAQVENYGAQTSMYGSTAKEKDEQAKYLQVQAQRGYQEIEESRERIASYQSQIREREAEIQRKRAEMARMSQDMSESRSRERVNNIEAEVRREEVGLQKIRKGLEYERTRTQQAQTRLTQVEGTLKTLGLSRAQVEHNKYLKPGTKFFKENVLTPAEILGFNFKPW